MAEDIISQHPSNPGYDSELTTSTNKTGMGSELQSHFQAHAAHVDRRRRFFTQARFETAFFPVGDDDHLDPHERAGVGFQLAQVASRDRGRQ